MREIKFRAWDNKNKEFVRAVPSLEILLDDPDAPVRHHDYSDDEAVYFYPNDPMGPTFNGRIEYEQYTGLKDKKEKEIYEGDIIKTNQGTIHKFVFENGKFCLTGHWCDFEYEFSGRHSLLVEVIGNIHKNPELLN